MLDLNGMDLQDKTTLQLLTREMRRELSMSAQMPRSFRFAERLKRQLEERAETLYDIVELREINSLLDELRLVEGIILLRRDEPNPCESVEEAIQQLEGEV